MTIPRSAVVDIIKTKGGVVLRKVTLPNGQYWLETNKTKLNSPWAQLALKGFKVLHLLSPENDYLGFVAINGKIYNYQEARAKFL